VERIKAQSYQLLLMNYDLLHVSLFQLALSENHLKNLKANLSTFLRDDQINKLKMKNGSCSRCSEWSTETIQHALSIRTAVGRNGYEHLRKLGYPLPSYRTLCRRLESAPFAPGIQSDVIEWLKCKLADKKDHHKECVLLVDEMQLKQRVEYDKGLRQLVGYVSPDAMTPVALKAQCKEMASHALVFMVRGLAVSWKQTVAYLYTGNKLDKEVFWSFMTKVISSLEIAGLKVRAVISDMGPINLGVWNRVGIKSCRDEVIPAVTHPSSSDRLLYFRLHKSYANMTFVLM
jgi:Transposase protein